MNAISTISFYFGIRSTLSRQLTPPSIIKRHWEMQPAVDSLDSNVQHNDKGNAKQPKSEQPHKNTNPGGHDHENLRGHRMTGKISIILGYCLCATYQRNNGVARSANGHEQSWCFARWGPSLLHQITQEPRQDHHAYNPSQSLVRDASNNNWNAVVRWLSFSDAAGDGACQHGVEHQEEPRRVHVN